jgi:hypothetical protein
LNTVCMSTLAERKMTEDEERAGDTRHGTAT